MQRVFYAVLLLFHFNFGSSANLDHSNTASQFGQTLLQLLTVVVGSGVFNLLADLVNAGFDVSLGASAVNNSGVILVDLNALGLTQVLQSSGFQAQANFFADHGTTGQDGDVLQHGFAAVAEARCLDSSNLDDAAHVVDNQSRQRFAFNVFSDDHQRTTSLGNGFQHRQQLADVGDFLVDQQDVRVVQISGHGFRLVDEIGRQVAAVKLHAFNNRQLVFQTGTFFNGDDAFFTNAVHGFGDDAADGLVRVGRDGAYLGDGLRVGTGLGQIFQLGNDASGGFVDTALEIHRVHASSNRFQTFGNDSLSQYGSSGSTVPSVVIGAGGNVFDQLGAHVFELVFQFDFFGNGNTVFGDQRRAEAALDQHVAALRTQGSFYCVGQRVDAVQHLVATGNTEFNFFCSHDCFPSNEFVKGLAAAGSAFDYTVDFGLAHDQQVFTINLDGVVAGVRTEYHLVAFFDGERTNFTVVLQTPGTYSNDNAGIRLFSGRTGQHDTASGLGFFFAATNDYAIV